MPRVVLVVDDEPLVLRITADMLEDLGCEVITAHNAEEALKKLTTDDRIEILMTDINMPGMDGCELAKSAMEMRGDLKVIVLSGRSECRGFPLIRKPFLREDIKRTMAHNTGLCWTISEAPKMFNLPFPSPSDVSVFDPETIRILSDAYEAAWQSLHATSTSYHLDGQEEHTSEILARCIIQVAKLGERDPCKLRDAALVHLAEANVRRARI